MINIPLNQYVAVLIDGDNVPPSCVGQVLKIADYYGRLEICRVYGIALSSWSGKIDTAKIDLIPVNNVGKNSTDNWMLVEAGEILGNGHFGNAVDVFVTVSGDGDFASACKLIQKRGKQVIGISHSGNTASNLRESCNKFYDIEDLGDKLGELEKLHPISPSEVREFNHRLFFAYHRLVGQKNDWVSYSQIDKKLRELFPDFESTYDKHELSEWLRSLDRYYESREQMIRGIDPTPLELLFAAYFRTRRSDGRAHLGQLGEALREIDSDYEGRFGSRKLSKWLQDYPYDFIIHDNYVWRVPPQVF